MDRLIDAINALHSHDTLESVRLWSQILLAVFALCSLLFTMIQVRQIAQESVKRTAHGKATFLYNLDTMFESEGFSQCRLRFVTFRDDADAGVRRSKPHLDPHSRQQEFADRASEKRGALKASDPDCYSQIMKFAGFFETACVVADSGEIEKRDIARLYRAAIVPYYFAPYKHIQKRQEDEKMPDLYENFLKLGKELYDEAARLENAHGRAG